MQITDSSIRVMMPKEEQPETHEVFDSDLHVGFQKFDPRGEVSDYEPTVLIYLKALDTEIYLTPANAKKIGQWLIDTSIFKKRDV